MTNIIFVSPNYDSSNMDLTHLTLEDKIAIFADRVFGWQLDIADQVINGRWDENGNQLTEMIPNSGFATLHILLSYFEMIAKYEDGYDGERLSEAYFTRGVSLVFPSIDAPKQEVTKLLKTLYEDARCGLYHAGMALSRVIITGDIQYPICFSSDHVIINPHRLVEELKKHFASYITRLQDSNNTQLRKNFEKRYDVDSKVK